MGRLLIYNPKINKNTVLHFNFTKRGSWKLRDYSSGKEKEILSSQRSNLSVEDIMSTVKWQEKADSDHSVKEHSFWKDKTDKYNKKLNELIGNGLLNEEVETHDPIDLAINNNLKKLIKKAKRIPTTNQLKLNLLDIINDIFEIEKISKANHSAALDPANTILKKVAADMCERNGISRSKDFFVNLKELERNNILSEKILLYYHFIRKLRNNVVHPELDNQPDINVDDIRMIRFMLSNIINWHIMSLK
jgi:hypothetical protein